MRKSGTNYRVPAVRNGARCPTVLHMFLSFSVVSSFVEFQAFVVVQCFSSSVSPKTLVLNLNQMPANYTKKDNSNTGKTDVC